ncbi:hypothetical protein MJ575_24515 [Klebsiella pneumoniae]|nr:hypothetical protein MJ575_24515 [Klebsiella pneumoniae]
MKPFFGVQAGDMFIATTGYTGEAGYEIAMPTSRRLISGAVCWTLALSRAVQRARHPAPGGRDELVRPGDGRRRFPAGGEHGLDYRTGARRS